MLATSYFLCENNSINELINFSGDADRMCATKCSFDAQQIICFYLYTIFLLLLFMARNFIIISVAAAAPKTLHTEYP